MHLEFAVIPVWKTTKEYLLTSSWNIFASSSPIVRFNESSLSALLESILSASLTVNCKCSWSFSLSPSASPLLSGSSLSSVASSASPLFSPSAGVSFASVVPSFSVLFASSLSALAVSSSSSPPSSPFVYAQKTWNDTHLKTLKIWFFAIFCYLCLICVWWSRFVACSFHWSFRLIFTLENIFVWIFTVVGDCLFIKRNVKNPMKFLLIIQISFLSIFYWQWKLRTIGFPIISIVHSSMQSIRTFLHVANLSWSTFLLIHMPLVSWRFSSVFYLIQYKMTVITFCNRSTNAILIPVVSSPRFSSSAFRSQTLRSVIFLPTQSDDIFLSILMLLLLLLLYSIKPGLHEKKIWIEIHLTPKVMWCDFVVKSFLPLRLIVWNANKNRTIVVLLFSSC